MPVNDSPAYTDPTTQANLRSDLITANELARRLAISKRSLWRLRSAGQLPEPIRLGGAVRWRLEDIQKWIADGCPAPRGRDNVPRRK
ncbi:MAG: helix-turn-helix transcriptional regulator [Pirellulales bacterium]